MNITINERGLDCFVNGKNLYNRRVHVYEDSDDESSDDDDEDEETERKELTELYSQTFSTLLITQLTKVIGQVGTVQVMYGENLPLLLKIKLGSIGSMSVYVKSKELIQMLADDEEEEYSDE